MHLSTLWRNALLSAPRHSRQNVLKDMIWVDSSSPMAVTSPSPRPTLQTTQRVCLPMPRNYSHQTWGRYHAQVERNIERAHARGKAKGVVENLERSGSESGLGGVDSGVCVSDPLDLLTGTLRRGSHFSAITVEECGVSNAWSDLQHAPFVPSILCTQLEETSKDGNGESGRMEDVDYLKRVSVALGRAC